MSDPYARGVFATLSVLEACGDNAAMTDFRDRISTYDYLDEFQVTRGNIRAALKDLLDDGSIEHLGGNRVRMSTVGRDTKKFVGSLLNRV